MEWIPGDGPAKEGRQDTDGDPSNGCEKTCEGRNLSASGGLDVDLPVVRITGVLTAACWGKGGGEDTGAVLVIGGGDTGFGMDATSGGDTGGGTIQCGQSQRPCGQTCKNVQSDPQNCGRCGVTCETGQICVKGSCQAQTQDCREEPCKGLYVNLKLDHNGEPHIMSFETDDDKLLYTYRRSGRFYSKTIVDEGRAEVGRYPSQVLTGNLVLVAYYHDSGGDLEFRAFRKK